MKAFYCDILGFRVEWQPDEENVYLTSGTDNLALHRAEGAAGGTGWTALDHVGLLVAAADAVDEWAAFLDSKGVAVDARPRTHRDGARSLYLRDPDGNRLQIIYHPPIAGRRA
jgi:catechol 2,3-dioxygenase-like lactoylglutathione lyase family enzyme